MLSLSLSFPPVRTSLVQSLIIEANQYTKKQVRDHFSAHKHTHTLMPFIISTFAHCLCTTFYVLVVNWMRRCLTYGRLKSAKQSKWINEKRRRRKSQPTRNKNFVLSGLSSTMWFLFLLLKSTSPTHQRVYDKWLVWKTNFNKFKTTFRAASYACLDNDVSELSSTDRLTPIYTLQWLLVAHIGGV